MDEARYSILERYGEDFTKKEVTEDGTIKPVI